MIKPLQDRILVKTKDGNYETYDKESVEFLIDGANCYITEGDKGPSFKVALAKSFLVLMTEYEKNGPSNALIDELTKFLESMKYQCLVGRKSGKLITTYIAHLTTDPGQLACYLFSSMSSLGWLDGLKRCKSPDCKNFFIGKSNRTWCSTSCGSRSRVKKMRKKIKLK